MNDLHSVGEKLRKLREQKGLTLAEVADKIGKSTSLIGSIERTDRCPSLPSLIELAAFYEVPLAYLFEDDLHKYQQEICALLKTKLAEQGKSVATLANLTGIHFLKLADFFQGEVSLTIDELRLIAVIVRVPLQEIIPQVARYIAHIRHYLQGLGLRGQVIENIVEYIYSHFEV